MYMTKACCLRILRRASSKPMKLLNRGASVSARLNLSGRKKFWMVQKPAGYLSAQLRMIGALVLCVRLCGSTCVESHECNPLPRHQRGLVTLLHKSHPADCQARAVGDI